MRKCEGEMKANGGPVNRLYCVPGRFRTPWRGVRAPWFTKPTTSRGVADLSDAPNGTTNHNPWPVGAYKVDLYLNDAKKPTQTLKFEVK